MRQVAAVLRRSGLISALAVMGAAPCAAWAAQAQGGFDFNSDAVLVKFLMRDDVVMSRVLASCNRLTVTRHKASGHTTFILMGFCLIKDNPRADLDCPGYDVVARGEIDDNVQATLRKVSLALVCVKRPR